MEYKVTLPPIDDSCKDGKCKHKHDHILSNEPEPPRIETYTPPPPPVSAPPAQESGHEGHGHGKPTPIDVTHTEMAKSMPSSINFGKCTGDKCGDKIKNENLNKDFKTCPKCGDNSIPLKAKYCKTCGQDEPKDKEDREDYWNESEIDSDTIEDEDEDE